MKFGAHMSVSGGVCKALERGASVGCEVVQIFVKNNMQWFGRPHPPADVAQFKQKDGRPRFASVFGHTGYLINLGAGPSENRAKSLQSLVQEINFAHALGLPFIVLHPGAHLGAGETAGLRQIVAGLDEVLRATRGTKVRIALENTAGQGSCLGHQIEHLAAIYDAVATPARLGLCIDTAHLLAAGYDIRTGGGWDKTIRRLEALIGRKEILAFHLNDSKTSAKAKSAWKAFAISSTMRASKIHLAAWRLTNPTTCMKTRPTWPCCALLSPVLNFFKIDFQLLGSGQSRQQVIW